MKLKKSNRTRNNKFKRTRCFCCSDVWKWKEQVKIREIEKEQILEGGVA